MLKINYTDAGYHSPARARQLILNDDKEEQDKFRFRKPATFGNGIPAFQKDEQARSIARMRKLQIEALKLWHTLKKKHK